jgi:hypothetical protein
MKSSHLLLILCLISFSTTAQTIIYENGGIRSEDRVLRRPKDVAVVIQNKESSELRRAFEVYETSRTTSTILINIGGAATGIYLGTKLRGTELNSAILYGGLGLSALGIILGIQSVKAMKNLVNIYNNTPVKQPKISVVPLIKSDGGLNEVGIAVKF